MDIETMFTEQKWNILKCLSEEKYSPLQLAEKLDTTMANVSQQLRLLEASNLIKKEKVKNRDKGKPRTLFSLSKDYAYMISASDKFAEKRLLGVNEHHKTIMRIWFLEDMEMQYTLERLYWRLEQDIKDVAAIAVNTSTKDIIIVSDSIPEIEKALKDFKASIRIMQKKDAEKAIRNQKGFFSDTSKMSVIYDPESLLKKNKALLNAI